MTALLEERERTRLAELTNVDEDVIERIIEAAAAERLVLVLPAFHVAGDFAGWDIFASEGQAKAAHLAEAGAFRALCSAPRPFNGVIPGARTRLCIGCESHVRGLAQNPSAVKAYNRGEAPPPLGDSPMPPTFRKPQAASSDEATPRCVSRPSAVKAAPAPARRIEPPVAIPSPPPEPVAPPPTPSLFDAAPVSTPRARPARPF